MKLDRVIAVRNDKTIYRDADKCIKVFHSVYTKADILNEALNQARIEETALKTPTILEIAMYNGKWAMVSEYIKGKSLAQLMLEKPDRKNEYLELFVDLQIKVHTETCPHLNQLRDKLNFKLGSSDLDDAMRRTLHDRLYDMPVENKICHGDFNPSNIIIAEDGTPYIIDWAHATQGSTEADTARTYLKFLTDEKSSDAASYLELYCARSNADKQQIMKWMPIVAASLTVTCTAKERSILLQYLYSQNF